MQEAEEYLLLCKSCTDESQEEKEQKINQVTQNMKVVRVEQVDTGEPNWDHGAAGIRCRADWMDAMVYVIELPNGDETRIIACSRRDALATAESLTTTN